MIARILRITSLIMLTTKNRPGLLFRCFSKNIEFKSGIFKQQYQYKSFSPVTINHEWTWDDSRINSLLEESITALSQFATFSRFVPDVDRFIFMHVVKEANTSSRIEGTQTEMDEAVVSKEYIADEKRDDWQEVQNYIAAMNEAIEELEKLPLSNRLLRQTHARLLEGVRGEQKTPGDFLDDHRTGLAAHPLPTQPSFRPTRTNCQIFSATWRNSGTMTQSMFRT